MFWKRKHVAKIFINYRREDTRWVAGRLIDTLRAYFGADRVFRDIEGLAGGAEFGNIIDTTMDFADAVIVLIGHDWLTATNSQGERRLDDPNDWVAREIEAALQQDVPVYPVLIDNTPLPRREELPASLKPLIDRNAMAISEQRWSSDVNRLAKIIAIDVPGTAAERTLNWVRLVVSLALFVSVLITTGIVTLRATEATGYQSFLDWFDEGWFGKPSSSQADAGLDLLFLWQSGLTYLVIVASSIVLLVFAPLIDASRRAFVYASGLVGILGAGFFFFLMAPLENSIEPVVMLLGSTVVATAMFVLMNLSGFKPK